MSERYYSYIDPTVGLGSQTISDQQANGEFYGVRNSVDIVARNIQATGNFIGALVADNTTFLNLNVTGIATVTEMQVGFVSSTDLLVTGISTVGVVTGGTYYGDGSNLTGIAASSLSVDGQTIVDISLSPDLAFVNGRLGIGSTTPTSALDVVNTKTVGEKLQTWIGDQHSLDVENFSSGDYSIVNSATGNGIKIYNSTSGVEILYNNSPLISCTDNFVDVSGSFLASGITSSIFGTGTQQIILDPAGPGPQFHIKTSNGEHDGILLDMDDDQGSNNFYAINVRLSDSPQNHTDNTNTKFLVNAEGNVLLNYGTNLDTGYWLDVNGTGRFTGDLTVSTNIYSNGNRVLTTGDEGTGNGLDADTLDSYHATDFATSSQGTLADSAIQSGDNISVLNNDAGYVTGVSTFSGDYNDLTNTPTIPTNNNQLTNGAGYITASDSAIPTNNNQLTNGAGYVTSTGTVALAEGLTGTPNITVNDVTSSSVISSSYTANSNIIIQPSGSTQGRTVSILGGDDDDGVGGNIFIGEGGSGGHIYFRSNGGEDSYRFAKSGQTAIEGFLNFNNLTADRKFHFPDQAGTLFLSGGNLSELNNDVGFATAGVSPWTRDGTDIYYNGGNVGIQQDAPQGLLHIGNTNRTLSTTVDTELLQLRLQADTSNADKLDFFVRRKETGSAWTSAFQRIQRIVDTSPMGFIQFGRNNVDPISFGNNESVFITMDNTGSLGIGVTDPSSSLEVLSTSASKPAIIVKNSGTLADDPIIQRWVGDSNSLELRNYADGDYELMNTQQNNGIRIYDGTAGVELLYNGSEALKCDSGGVKANGSRVLTVADEGSGNGIDADTVDGIQASSFVRGDGVDNGSIFIEVADADYVVRDSTDTIINFIWRDHSEGKLFLGNSAAIPTTRADLVTGDGDSYWHAGNDGSGSGLDADTVDGIQASSFLRSDADDTVTGNINFTSTTVPITTNSITFVNTENDGNYYTDAIGVLAFDENFHSDTNYGTGTYAPDTVFTGGNGGGILIKNEDGWGAIYTTQNTRWASAEWANLKIGSNQVWHAGNDGSGSGLDADTLDGQEGSYYTNATNIDSGTINTARLPGTYSKASQVVFEATGTSNDFKINAGDHIFLTSGVSEDGNIYFRGNGGTDSYRFSKSGQTAIEGFLSFESLSADRTFTFPNKTGTVAMTSDITDAGSGYATAAQGALADTAIQPSDDASLNTLTLANLEKSDLTSDGQIAFDSSQGILVFRTQQGTNDATTVLDGANVDAGTGINITNLGAGSESTTPFTFSIDSTVLTTSGGSLTDGSSFTLPGYHDDKLIIGISGSTNTIGFTSSTTYGDLNGDAMLFRMGNDGDGGYLWRQTNQTNSQGNMSLSNEGRLTVARSIDVGTGVDDTGSAGYPLFVQNSLEDTGGNSASIVGFIDANFTGSTTFTSNRTHTGLRVDADSDVTGHTTTDGSRLTNYSIYATCNSSTGYFANYGVRSLSRTDLQPTGSNAQSTYGFYGQAQVYNTNGTGANSNTYGGMFIGQQGGTDTVGLVVGVYGKANLTTNGANKSQTLLAGVIGEAEIDEETVNAAYSFYGIIDRDGGTVTNGILYGGSNGTEFNNATTDSWQGTIGTKWGINIHGSDKNYLDGETTLYSDTAATPALITENKGSLGSVPIIQRWVGDSDALELRNHATGDYELVNTQQNNGIRIMDGTAGVELLYNGSEALKCDSNGVQISGSTVLTAADAGSYLKSDEDDSFTGTLTGISDATNPVITLQGSGPNIIRFLDNTSTTLGIDLVYRVTPHTLGFEKSVDGTTLWETDCDTGITDFSYTPTVNGTTLATTTALGDGSVTEGSNDFRAGAFATFQNDGGGNAGYRINATAHTSTFIENGSAWESEFSNDSTNGDWTLYRAQGNAGETCTWEAQIRNEGDDRSMRLYCQGTERMATTGSGISVTGAVVVTTDIESTTASQGLILKSPNGTRYRVTVDNSGNLTTSAA